MSSVFIVKSNGSIRGVYASREAAQRAIDADIDNPSSSDICEWTVEDLMPDDPNHESKTLSHAEE